MKPASIKNLTTLIPSHNQEYKIFYQEFLPENPVATLILSHGLGEHSDAYRSFCFSLAKEAQIKIIAWDLYGHGRSDGPRGHVGDVKWFLNDLEKISHHTCPEKNQKLFFFGHSLGGLITLSAEKEGLLNAFSKRKFILSNPCLGLKFEAPKWKLFASQALVRLAPMLTLDSGLNVKDLSSDPDYWEDFKNDDLRHTKISSRLFIGMNELMEKISPLEVKAQSLALLSPKDPICSFAIAKKLLAQNAEIKTFNHSLHEVLNDIEKENAFNDIKEFINANI